jgi:hypothetical protein
MTLIPGVSTGLMAGFDLDWDGLGVQGQSDAVFDLRVFVTDLDDLHASSGFGTLFDNEHAPTTEVRHLSSWGTLRDDAGEQLALKAGDRYFVRLAASPTTPVEGCTSAQIERGELTIQYAGLTP